MVGQVVSFHRKASQQTNSGYYRQQKATGSSGKIYTKSGAIFQRAPRIGSFFPTSAYSSYDKRIVFNRNPTKSEVGGSIKEPPNKLGKINPGSQHPFYSRGLQNTFSNSTGTKEGTTTSKVKPSSNRTSEPGNQRYVEKRCHSEGPTFPTGIHKQLIF